MKIKPPRIALVILGSAFTLAFAGCASSYKAPQARHIAEQEKLNVAVLPFAISKQAGGGEASDGIRKFESNYFPVRFAQTLGRSSHVKHAFYSPVATPAVDYVFRGIITKADGRTTKVAVTLEDLEGRKLWTKSYSYTVKSSAFSEKNPEPGAAIWHGPVNDFENYIRSQKGGVHAALGQARARAYSEGSAPATEKAVTMANKAAEIERSSLLSPLTKQAEDEAVLMQALYSDWSRESARIQEERSRAQASATGNMIFGMLQAAAAGAAQGTGNYADATTLQNNAMQSMERSQLDSSRASELENQLGSLKFAVETNAKPISLTFENKTFTLKGAKDSQMREFRKVVKDQLTKAS